MPNHVRVENKDIRDVLLNKRKMGMKQVVFSTFAPAVLGFSMGNAVLGILNERSYAVSQLAATAAVSVCYCKRRFEKPYEKTARVLKKVFSNDNIVFSNGTILINTTKSLPFVKPKDYTGIRYTFSMDDWTPIIEVVRENVWSNVTELGLCNNIEKGQGVQESILNAIHQVVLEEEKGSFSKKDIVDYLKNAELSRVLLLKMCSDMMEKVSSCLADEEVLHFLQEGVLDRTSILYGVNSADRVNAFLNRTLYEKGPSSMLTALKVGKGVSMMGCVASGVMDGVLSGASFVCAGLTGAFSCMYLKKQERHVDRQNARYRLLRSNFAELDFLGKAKMDDGNLLWVEKNRTYSNFAFMKLYSSILKDVEQFLSKMPKEMCKDVVSIFYTSFVLRDGAVYNVVSDLEKGMTLEDTVKKNGFKNFHKAMMLDILTGELKRKGRITVHSYAYELKLRRFDAEEALQKLYKERVELIEDQVEDVETLCLNGVVTEEEKQARVQALLNYDIKINPVVISKTAKLPCVIEKLKREIRIREEN